MNATQNHIRKNQDSRRKRTTKVTQTTGRIRPLASKTKDSKRNTERQAEICPNRNASNGFLRCRFLPKHTEPSILKSSNVTAKIEGDFYKSLSNLARIHQIEPMNTANFNFPYNIALAIWDIENKFKNIDEDWKSFKLIEDKKKIYFAKEERYSTGTSLFYIPIVRIFQMLKDRSYKRNGQLLLSVCSYLYNIVSIPYYRHESSYLHWIYEMHEEWIEQDELTEEDTQESKHEFRISKIIGDIMEQKLINTKNMEMFEQRLVNFECHSDFDLECYKLASDAFALYVEYPKTSAFINQPIFDDSQFHDDENNAIRMDMYISFVAATKGCLYDNIEESINAEFNEYGSVEEPTIYTPITKMAISNAKFDFENRLFTLLENLCTLLNK
ncbi:hypothetical protein [Chryseobacterium aureum]|uniref:hypothetical protein n=1 Tax=Chryseobacterium aureum TaxID=2497456 RepID=UPI000F871147|nr:hypothetical protein [Chryseobacterium aureum]